MLYVPEKRVIIKEKRWSTFNKGAIKRAAEQSAVLMQIETIIWDYMIFPKQERNGVEMANTIYKLVEKQVKKELKIKEKR